MRDALILLPVSLAVLAGIWKVDDLMIGASGDMVRRWVPLYFLAWFVAWLMMTFVMSVRGLRDRDFSHFTRCIVAVLLVWPVLAVTTSIAEEWTIAHRIATWKEPSDTGYNFLYWEMSGMGYARGWLDLPRRLASYSIIGVISSIAWVPALLLSLLGWSRIMKPIQRINEMNTHTATTKANKTDASNDSNDICRVSNILRSPSPQFRRSPTIMRTLTSLALTLIIYGLSLLQGLAQDNLTLVYRQNTDQKISSLEHTVRALETKVSGLEGSAKTAATGGGVSFLFGAFCAIWAQNTNRSAWLWFFLGLFFSVITVIFLLVKNSDDRFDRQQREQFTHGHK